MPLLFEYLQLCWFKNNPTKLHPSHGFLWKNVIFYLVSGIIVEANISDPADATLEVALRTVMALTLLSSQILFTKQSSVFYQLLNAVFICENAMMTLGIGVEIYDVFVQGTPYEQYPMILGGLLIVWYLAIISYIFKQVFSFAWVNCVLVAVLYFFCTYGVPFLFMEVI
jgi:hypothetical protein